MNKTNNSKVVYLDVFDSAKQIDPLRAEQVLFSEIVNKGNFVVLTFNQLTDSLAFMELWRDETRVNALNFLLQRGVIRINQYFQAGEAVRTASQYIQNSIEREVNGNPFIFSAWEKLGVRIADLVEVGKAIRYNDIYRLEVQFKDNENKELLINYFKMITSLSDSVDSKTYLEPIANTKKFSDFMRDIVMGEVLSPKIRELLKMILDNNCESAQVNNRSFWYKQVERLANQEDVLFLKKLIDQCYTFTLMASVDESYTYDEAVLQFELEDDDALVSQEAPNWEIAVRLFEDDKLMEESKQNFQVRIFLHFLRITWQAVLLTGISLFLMLFIGEAFDYGREYAVNLLDGVFQVNGTGISTIIYAGAFVCIVIVVLIVGEYFSSIIFEKLQLPGLLESLSMLRYAIIDRMKMKEYNRKQGEHLTYGRLFENLFKSDE